MPVTLSPSNKKKNVVIPRHKLSKKKVDTGHRDLLVGFNEPAFRFSRKGLTEADLDAKLNARFPSYFLPLVTVARQQPSRPRLFLVSALNMALKWNAHSERQKSIMMIDNYLKLDFLRSFFETFFPDDFSMIEYIVAQDPIKVSEDKLLALWKVLERRYPEKVEELKLKLAQYKRPQLFNGSKLSDEAMAFLATQNEELIGAFKYAVSHLFVMADINFEGNYVHNPIGYLTVGGPAEETFNAVRELALQVLQDIAELVFERDVIFKDNIRLIVKHETSAPVPYNGYFRTYGNNKLELAEATYENEESLDFYDKNPQLKPDMDYIYSFVGRTEYEKFWEGYKDRYFELKRRYREAYRLAEDF